jgi:hypothetical protein
VFRSVKIILSASPHCSSLIHRSAYGFTYPDWCYITAYGFTCPNWCYITAYGFTCPYWCYITAYGFTCPYWYYLTSYGFTCPDWYYITAYGFICPDWYYVTAYVMTSILKTLWLNKFGLSSLVVSFLLNFVTDFLIATSDITLISSLSPCSVAVVSLFLYSCM